MTNGQQSSRMTEGGHEYDAGRHSGDAERQNGRRSWLQLGVLCYLLALPLLSLEISNDIGFGRDLCDPRPVGSLGTIFDSSGSVLCQIEIAGVLVLWTVFAGMVLLLPILVRSLYRRMRRENVVPDEGGNDQIPQSVLLFGLSIVFYTLLAIIAAYVVYWEVTIFLANLAVGYPTGNNCLCVGIDLGNYGGLSNSDGIQVCCTLYIDQTLYLFAVYPLLVVSAAWMARYVYGVLRSKCSERVPLE